LEFAAAVSAGVLAVRCETCGPRAALGKDRLPIYRGNMTPVTSLELCCQMCGEKERFALYIPFDQDEVDAFLRSEDMEHRRVTYFLRYE